jgi:hypothetical protein
MNIIRCSLCGKFISYKDVGTDKIHFTYIPDTEFTHESYEWEHEKCIKKDLSIIEITA